MERLREVAATKERENSDSEKRIKNAEYEMFKMQEKA